MSNFLATQERKTQFAAVHESRQLAEAQTAIYLAKQFPRDEEYSLQRILHECTLPRIAESAMYSYSRGDSEVKGPSIRLAEVIARHWGNFSCGVDEIEQRNGESIVKAYAWDYETNYRDEKIFTVKHERTAKGNTKKLTESRDIYEMVANSGARRKRACILAVIPSYVVDEAIDACQRTLAASVGTGKDLEEYKNKMAEAFVALDERITTEVLAAKIGKDYDKFNAKDIVKLRSLYSAINDGFVKAAQAFDFAADGMTVSDEENAELEAINKEIMGESSNE